MRCSTLLSIGVLPVMQIHVLREPTVPQVQEDRLRGSTARQELEQVLRQQMA
jgi:hypothetical protein